MSPKKVCIIGSGNWGSAISKLVGFNTRRLSDIFQAEVSMWVFEEQIKGRSLSEIINTDHENIKYLPGTIIPDNIIAVPDIVKAAEDSDILIFVLPHKFVKTACDQLKGKLKTGVQGLSLIKGFYIPPGGRMALISDLISEELDIPMSVMMGANLANEVAADKFSETTIGVKGDVIGQVFQSLFQTENFKVTVVKDVQIVEICGALKNIVACAAGFCDGLEMGYNTKAATIGNGLKEIKKFADIFYPGGNYSTYFESCGVPDLITSCYGGRNRKVSAAFVSSYKSISELEGEMLNGQKLQGPETAESVNQMLRSEGLEEEFPLFTAVHKICTGQLSPLDLVDALKNKP